MRGGNAQGDLAGHDRGVAQRPRISVSCARVMPLAFAASQATTAAQLASEQQRSKPCQSYCCELHREKLLHAMALMKGCLQTAWRRW